MRTYAMLLVAVLTAGEAGAQAPSEAQLEDVVGLGTIAALAPLCGLREEEWSFDLRRAAIQSATRTTRHDDAGLKAAPGSDIAASALSFAEAEALESFAEAAPDATCGPLAQHPELARADRMVQEFRSQRPGS